MTLTDEDTNSMLTDDANKKITSNMTMHMALLNQKYNANTETAMQILKQQCCLVQCGGEPCQGTSISGLPILLSHPGRIRPGLSARAFFPSPSHGKSWPRCGEDIVVPELWRKIIAIWCILGSFNKVVMDSKALQISGNFACEAGIKQKSGFSKKIE